MRQFEELQQTRPERHCQEARQAGYGDAPASTQERPGTGAAADHWEENTAKAHAESGEEPGHCGGRCRMPHRLARVNDVHVHAGPCAQSCCDCCEHCNTITAEQQSCLT